MDKKNCKTRKTVNIIVHNRVNVLIKLVSFFEKRGFTVEHVNLIEIDKPEVSKYNMIIFGDNKKFRKYLKQLFRFTETIDVILI